MLWVRFYIEEDEDLKHEFSDISAEVLLKKICCVLKGFFGCRLLWRAQA